MNFYFDNQTLKLLKNIYNKYNIKRAKYKSSLTDVIIFPEIHAF